ncbi:MAG: polysaccharide biosynthesis/export family protein [Candidatus Omnitrophica bacterium]|nr:polysaccharide biosynthesis/export family protein [Candidatus Omnitrophota bacterium]
MRIILRIFIVVINVFWFSLLLAGDDDIEKARQYYELGNILYQEGKYDQAQQQYQKALELLQKKQSSSLTSTPSSIPLPSPTQQSQLPEVPKRKEEPRLITEYRIGDEDILKISVWQNDDLNQEVIVRPDGKISFPLIGDVPARGLTIPELDEEITHRLSEYVRSPEVSISLVKMGGSRVIILGQVHRPGVYNVSGAKTILEAIGLAGGFTNDAVPSSTILIRGGFIDPKPQRINLSKALKGKNAEAFRISLQPEDIIYVPKKFIADINYVLSLIVDPIAKGTYIKDTYEKW